MQTAGRVLIIEDEEVLAATTAELLQRRGHECEVEASLAGVRARANLASFDTLITDLNLPGGHDLEVLDLVRDIEPRPTVLVITGFPSVENAVRAIDQGVYAYRTKPFDMEEFLDTVDAAVAQSKLQRRLARSHQRFAEITQQLDTLRDSTRGRGNDDLDQSLVQYALLLLGSNADSLAEAMEVLRLVDHRTPGKPLRRLSRHPETEMFRRAIEHTIGVLDKTRTAFKSKELADLRRRLEVALAQATPASEH